MSSYEDALSYIEEIPRFSKKSSPAQTLAFLGELGHPEEAFKVIHVAGTNGKGSVCAFLESILRSGGFRCGLFTSPHLIRINERFQLMREEISDEDFACSFDICHQAVLRLMEKGCPHPSYFEFLFGMGMVWFKKMKTEILLLETGLGGRLDASNCVAHPIISVITSISMDHMQYLGNSIEKIAYEKAGIIKAGVPLVYDAQSKEAEQVILERAKAMNSAACGVDMSMVSDIRHEKGSVSFLFNNSFYENLRVRVPFPADYQIINACIALTALRLTDPAKNISDEKAVEAVSGTKWSGRMDEVMEGVFIDGAHNEDGIRKLLESVRYLDEKNEGLSLLYSSVADKEYEKLIALLCREGHFKNITVTEIKGTRSVSASLLADIFRTCTDAEAEPVRDVREAFHKALKKKGDGILLCTGSLYLAGEILGLVKEGRI